MSLSGSLLSRGSWVIWGDSVSEWYIFRNSCLCMFWTRKMRNTIFSNCPRSKSTRLYWTTPDRWSRRWRCEKKISYSFEICWYSYRCRKYWTYVNYWSYEVCGYVSRWIFNGYWTRGYRYEYKYSLRKKRMKGTKVCCIVWIWKWKNGCKSMTWFCSIWLWSRLAKVNCK